jgi:hypothetical protein
MLGSSLSFIQLKPCGAAEKNNMYLAFEVKKRLVAAQGFE